MKRKQVTAIVLAVIMAVSPCVPMNGVSAYAAEGPAEASTEASAEIVQETAEAEPEDAETEAEVQASGEPEEADAVTEDADSEADAEEEKAAAEAEEAEAEEEAKAEGTDAEEAEADAEKEAEADTEVEAEADAEEKAEAQETEADAEAEAEEPESAETEDVEASEDEVKAVSRDKANSEADPGEDNTSGNEAFTLEYASLDEFYEASGTECRLEVNSSIEDVSYEWFIDDECIEGASESYYIATKAGDYTVRATDGENNTLELTFSVCYTGDFTISYSETPDIKVYSGESAYLEVVNESGTELTYNWRVASEETGLVYEDYCVQGGESSLTIPVVNEALVVECRGVDEYGGTNSDTGLVTFYVRVDDTLTICPENAPGAESYGFYSSVGDAVSMIVTVESGNSSGITYAWYKKGNSPDEEYYLIEGAESSCYSVRVLGDMIKYYKCVATNPKGVSDEVYFSVQTYDSYEGDESELSYSTYEVYINEFITNEGVTVGYDVEDNIFTVDPGTECELRVSSTAEEDMTYEWYRNDVKIEGADSNTYVADSYGSYKCRACYHKTYWILRFEITNNVDFSISAVGDTDIHVSGGETVTLEVSPDPADADLIYNWTVSTPDGEIPDGGAWTYESIRHEEWDYTGDSATFTTPEVTQPFLVECTAEDKNGASNSDSCKAAFYIYPTSDMVVYLKNEEPGTDRAEFTITRGDSVDLEIVAEGSNTDGISYCWYKYGCYEGEEYYKKFTEGTGAPIALTVKAPGQYWCKVYDEYHVSSWNFYFDVIDTTEGDESLTAEYVSESSFDVPSGTECKLEVSTNFDEEDVDFSWYYDYECVEEDGGSSYTATKPGYYYVVVKDPYTGGEYTLDFNVTYTGNFTILPKGSTEIEVGVGECATLEVTNASDTELTYNWTAVPQEGDEYYGYNDVYGGSSVFTTPNVYEPIVVTCSGVDEYGLTNSETGCVTFYVRPDRMISAYPANEKPGTGSTVITASVGDGINLEVALESEEGLSGLTYTWYKKGNWPDGWYNVIEGAEGASYPVTVWGDMIKYYKCVVADDSGLKDTVYFTVRTPDSVDDEGWDLSIEKYDVSFEEKSLTKEGVTVGYDVENNIFTVEPGTECELRVSSSAKEDVSYRWYQDDIEIEGADTSVYATDVCGKYRCEVHYHRTYWILNFEVRNEVDFSISAVGETERNVTGGETVTLEVSPEPADADLTYCWSVYSLALHWDCDERYIDMIYPADGSEQVTENPTFTTPEMTGACRVVCIAKDDNGATDPDTCKVTYDLYPMTDMIAYPKYEDPGTDTKKVMLDSEAYLEVEVEGSDTENISYVWSEFSENSGEYNYIDDGEGRVLPEAVYSEGRYRCAVFDQYNAVARYVYFDVVAYKDLYDETKRQYTVDTTEFTYNGEEQKPEVIEVIYDGVKLVEGTDYTVYCEGDYVNVGRKLMYVFGKGEYDGGIDIYFDIKKADQEISVEDVSLALGETTTVELPTVYGELNIVSADPEIAVMDADGVVTSKGVGETEITITASGDDNHNEASAKFTVKVSAFDLSDETKTEVTLDATEFTYNGEAQWPAVIEVTYDGVKLEKDTDYGVSLEDDISIKAGRKRIFIYGINKYSGTIEKEYVINKADQEISVSASELDMKPGEEAKITVSGAMGELTYSSSAPAVATVGTDGTVNAVAPGNAEITVTSAADRNYNEAKKVITVTVTGGWINDGKGWAYYHDDGANPVSKFETIGGATYYFNASGYRVSGLQTIGGKKYYFNTGGQMQKGWQTIGGKKYYFNTSGQMLTGWQTIGGKKYYFNTSGQMQTGWQTIGGKRYYFNTSGQMQTGWQTIGGKRYYFNTSGQMLTGWQTISNVKYYFEKTGVMHVGWLKQGDNYYYFKTNGAMLTGWLKKGGKMYYFKTNGQRLSGWLKRGGKYFYFKTNGEMLTGWLKKSGKMYYFKTNGERLTGWLKRGGKYYYFQPSNGQMVTGRYKIGSKWYTFDKNGVRQ